MSVKVTKPGKVQTNELKGTCGRCGCEITCLAGDMTYSPRPGDDPFVKCPTANCQGFIYPRKQP